MDNAEYEQTQAQLINLTHTLLKLDLDTFIRMIELAHAAGPVLDPSLYLRAEANMTTLEQIARAFRQCQQTIEQLRADEARRRSLQNEAAR